MGPEIHAKCLTSGFLGMGVWSGGRVWIFSICWFQWYKCSHLANFSYLGDITECGVGENVHKHHSWAGASLSYSKLAPTHTHHCMGPCPRYTESQPWGLGPGSLSFNRPSRLLRGSQKFAKHCVCVVCKIIMEVSRLLGFLQRWKCSRWRCLNELLCWSHRFFYTKGVLGSGVMYFNVETHQ